jgi:hypothetical protein
VYYTPAPRIGQVRVAAAAAAVTAATAAENAAAEAAEMLGQAEERTAKVSASLQITSYYPEVTWCAQIAFPYIMVFRVTVCIFDPTGVYHIILNSQSEFFK